jgi:hypothetical protein
MYKTAKKVPFFLIFDLHLSLSNFLTNSIQNLSFIINKEQLFLYFEHRKIIKDQQCILVINLHTTYFFFLSSHVIFGSVLFFILTIFARCRYITNAAKMVTTTMSAKSPLINA